MLRTKHPQARPPTVESLDLYPYRPPELVPVDITDNTVTAVVRLLSGGEGPGGVDSVSLQHWLIRSRAASRELQLIVADFKEWLSNGRPPWAAYRAMMNG